MPKSASPSDVSTGARQVARACDELRRGWPVLIMEGDTALLALATETATQAEMRRLRQFCPSVSLILPPQRASVLHIQLKEDSAAAIAVAPETELEMLISLADATQDLDRPLRGPLISAPVPALAAPGLQLAKQARLLPSLIGGAPALAAGQTPAEFAAQHDLLTVDGPNIAHYEAEQSANLSLVAEARLPTALAEPARLLAFRATDGTQEHLALIVGDPKPHDPVLVRLHSECFTGDILGSLRCDCGEQLHGAMARMAKEGGILLYLRQEGRGIGLLNKLRAYHVQDQGFDTLDANLRLGFAADERLFRPAATILRRLGYEKVRLLTNNPDKVAGLEAAGLTVVERVPHAFPTHAHNEDYLRTKARRSGHYLDLDSKKGD